VTAVPAALETEGAGGASKGGMVVGDVHSYRKRRGALSARELAVDVALPIVVVLIGAPAPRAWRARLRAGHPVGAVCDRQAAVSEQSWVCCVIERESASACDHAALALGACTGACACAVMLCPSRARPCQMTHMSSMKTGKRACCVSV